MPRKSPEAIAKGKAHTRRWHLEHRKPSKPLERCPRCQGLFTVNLDGNLRKHICKAN